MEENTEPQMLLWLTYFDLDLNRPDKTEHYLASVACEARRIPQAVSAMLGNKRVEYASMKDCYLEFRDSRGSEVESKAVDVTLQKQVWLASVSSTGAGIVERRRSRAEALKIREEAVEDQHRLFSRYRKRR